MNHTIGAANEIVNGIHPSAFPGANGCTLLTVCDVQQVGAYFEQETKLF
jgi:hypothetical protein